MELLFNNINQKVSLNATDKKIISEKFRTKKVKRKEILVVAGEISKYLYFVTKGCLRAFYTDKNGFEHVVNFAVEDWWIGDFGFHTQSPATLTLEALEDSEVLYIDKSSLDFLYDEVKVFDRYFRMLLQKSLAAQFQRIMQINSFTAEERYVAFKDKYPQFDKRIPQKYLASYLGITPEFLSRLKKQLLKA